MAKALLPEDARALFVGFQTDLGAMVNPHLPKLLAWLRVCFLLPAHLFYKPEPPLWAEVGFWDFC